MSALCLVETKVDVLSPSMANDVMGMGFDYVCLPSVGASGGIVVAWRRDDWVVTTQTCRSFMVTICIAPSSAPQACWSLSVAYGPVLDTLKPAFHDEFRLVREHAVGPLLLCGDFNQIYIAADKNNDRLNLRAMRRFRRLLDELRL